MERVRIILSALWVAMMLTYLLGDVLKLFSGEVIFGGEGGFELTQAAWLGLAVALSLPIFMVVLSLTLKYPVVRWANIVLAGFLFLFNLVSLPTYPSAFEKYLIAVGLVFNFMTIWYAWKWA